MTKDLGILRFKLFGLTPKSQNWTPFMLHEVLTMDRFLIWFVRNLTSEVWDIYFIYYPPPWPHPNPKLTKTITSTTNIDIKFYFIFRIRKTIAPVKESNRTHRRDIDENEPPCYLIPTGWSYLCDRAELTLYLLCKPVQLSARNSHSINK